MRITVLTGSHNRRDFDCGYPALNDWLAKVARQHQGKGLSRTFVAVSDGAPEVVRGYYALTLTEVDTRELPEDRARKLPRIVPGVRLGRLAVDRRCQGRGLGELMLMDAMERVRAIREHAGAIGLFVDALDARAAGFYLRYGAVAFADEPLKLFLPVPDCR